MVSTKQKADIMHYAALGLFVYLVAQFAGPEAMMMFSTSSVVEENSLLAKGEYYVPRFGHVECIDLPEGQNEEYPSSSGAYLTEREVIACGDPKYEYSNVKDCQVYVKKTSSIPYLLFRNFGYGFTVEKCCADSEVCGYSETQCTEYEIDTLLQRFSENTLPQNTWLQLGDTLHAGEYYRVVDTSWLWSNSFWRQKTVANLYGLKYITSSGKAYKINDQGCLFRDVDTTRVFGEDRTKAQEAQSRGFLKPGEIINYIGDSVKVADPKNVIMLNGNEILVVAPKYYYPMHTETLNGAKVFDSSSAEYSDDIECVPETPGCQVTSSGTVQTGSSVPGGDCSILSGAPAGWTPIREDGKVCKLKCADGKLEASTCKAIPVCNVEAGEILNWQTYECWDPSEKFVTGGTSDSDFLRKIQQAFAEAGFNVSLSEVKWILFGIVAIMFLYVWIGRGGGGRGRIVNQPIAPKAAAQVEKVTRTVTQPIVVVLKGGML